LYTYSVAVNEVVDSSISCESFKFFMGSLERDFGRWVL